jgi:hypothetical protein
MIINGRFCALTSATSTVVSAYYAYYSATQTEIPRFAAYSAVAALSAVSTFLSMCCSNRPRSALVNFLGAFASSCIARGPRNPVPASLTAAQLPTPLGQPTAV